MNSIYSIDNAIHIMNITHEWYTAITYHAPESIPIYSCQSLWQMEGLHVLNTGHLLINADQRCDTKLIVLNAVDNNSILCKWTKKCKWIFSLFLHSGREQTTSDLKKLQRRPRRRPGCRVEMVPQCHGRGLPSLWESCWQSQSYCIELQLAFGAPSISSLFSACPG